MCAQIHADQIPGVRFEQIAGITIYAPALVGRFPVQHDCHVPAGSHWRQIRLVGETP